MSIDSAVEEKYSRKDNKILDNDSAAIINWVMVKGYENIDSMMQ